MAGTDSMDIFFCYRKASLHMQADKRTYKYSGAGPGTDWRIAYASLSSGPQFALLRKLTLSIATT